MIAAHHPTLADRNLRRRKMLRMLVGFKLSSLAKNTKPAGRLPGGNNTGEELECADTDGLFRSPAAIGSH
jgi:hypothetical protein